MSTETNCDHFIGIDGNVAPKTPGCEECEKEGMKILTRKSQTKIMMNLSSM